VLITYYIDTWVVPYKFKYLPSEALTLSVFNSTFTVSTNVSTFTGTFTNISIFCVNKL
jgi:hypothetical protein